MKTLLTSCILLFSWSLAAEIVVYKLAITNNYVGDSRAFKRVMTGRLILDAEGRQSPKAILWGKIGNEKQFQIDCPILSAREVTGPRGVKQTIIHITRENPHDITFLFMRGTNAILSLGEGSIIAAPNKFRGVLRESVNDGVAEFFNEASVTATYIAIETQVANSEFQTVEYALQEQKERIGAAGYIETFDEDVCISASMPAAK